MEGTGAEASEAFQVGKTYARAVHGNAAPHSRLAVIASDGRELQSARVSRHFAIPSSSMQAAVEALEARHLVRPDSRGGEVRHRLVDPFLAAWITEAQEV